MSSELQILENGEMTCSIVAGEDLDSSLPAQELSRYIEIRSLSHPKIIETSESLKNTKSAILVGNPQTNSLIKELQKKRLVSFNELGQQGYLIRLLSLQKGHKYLILGGNNRLANYYAVYDFLERILGVKFHFDKELFPEQRIKNLSVKGLNIIERPLITFRSFKPQILGDYSRLHSAWMWNLKRWKKAIRWCIQNRLNVLHLFFFSQMNWIAYGKYPKTKCTYDPLMSTEDRIRLIRKIISYGHEFGMKILIGFTTNGCTLEYAQANPEQLSTSEYYYEGSLCWAKAKEYLQTKCIEHIETYSEADGYVFWPHERLCQCSRCITGEPFREIILNVYQYIKENYPQKEIYLIDWTLPRRFSISWIPKDITLINVHEFSSIPRYIEEGLQVIFQPIINWDCASCTTISPNVKTLLAEMKNCLQMGAKGFEAHLVSMFSGELMIRAFAKISWNPKKFNTSEFYAQYLKEIYGEPVETYKGIFNSLEELWTPPYDSYRSIMDDVYDHEKVEFDKERSCATMLIAYEKISYKGSIIKIRKRVSLPREEALKLFEKGIEYLTKANKLLNTIDIENNRLRFLKASVSAQLEFTRWCHLRYYSLCLFYSGKHYALKKQWEEAEKSIGNAHHSLLKGLEALERLEDIVRKNEQWFRAKKGSVNRGLETRITTTGIEERKKDFLSYGTYTSDPMANLIVGPRFLERLIKEALIKTKKKEIPDLKIDKKLMKSYIKYP